jgi:hypothetical protein
MLTLDHQRATEPCDHCSTEYPVSRGTIFDSGNPIAIYLAGLHPCDSGARSAIFGIGVAPTTEAPPQAFSIQVWLLGDDYHMSLLDPEQSPWQSHEYLGRMLRLSEVLDSQRKTFYFELADCIVGANPDVKTYFAPDPSPKAVSTGLLQRLWRKRNRGTAG